MAVSNSIDRFNGLVASLAIKAPCVAVAIANITLSGEQTVNGVAVVSGDRVLVTAQTSSVDNGIYDVSSSAWSRAADFDGNRDVVSGTFVTVATATVGRNPYYQVTTANPITIGTTAIDFTLADGPNVSYALTPAEIAEGLTDNDIDDSYEPGFLLRYGANTIPGTTDLSTAMTNATAANKRVTLPAEQILFGSVIALTSAHNDLSIFAYGATINRGFSGTLFTYTGVVRVTWSGGKINGDFGTYTGSCFVLSGASDQPKWNDLETVGFTGNHYEFGADAGKKAKLIACDGRIVAGQGNARMVLIGTDTGAMQRSFVGCSFSGYIEVVGGNDNYFSSTSCTYLTTGTNTSILSYIGGIWGNSGGTNSIDGSSINIVGVRISSTTTLESGSGGDFVGNNFTAGGLVNNSTSTWFIAYRAPGEGYYTFNRVKLPIGRSVEATVRLGGSISAGDTNQTFNPASSASWLRYNTDLTANRTVTLSSTSATVGTHLHVSRVGGGAFTLDIGGLRNLAQNETIDVEWNGSAYEIYNVGALAPPQVIDLDDTGTPSVADAKLLRTGGTTAITDFDDGVVGQTIQIIAAHAVTITNGTPIILAGSANFVMAVSDTLTLTMFDDQVWQEVSRSVN